MTDFCCDECSYWEDRADINTENEIKMKVKTEETTIIAIPVQNNRHISKPVDNEYENKVIEVLAVEKVEVGKPKSPQ